MANNKTPLPNFKSVDALVEYFIDYYGYADDNKDELFRHIVIDNQGLLLAALKKETNKPSKHDLDLIKHITRCLDLDIRYSYHAQILEIYSNRKD